MFSVTLHIKIYFRFLEIVKKLRIFDLKKTIFNLCRFVYSFKFKHLSHFYAKNYAQKLKIIRQTQKAVDLTKLEKSHITLGLVRFF